MNISSGNSAARDGHPAEARSRTGVLPLRWLSLIAGRYRRISVWRRILGGATLIILIYTVGVLVIIEYFLGAAASEAAQRRLLTVANDIAQQFERSTTPLDEEAWESIAYGYQRYNSYLGVYVLDATGRVLWGRESNPGSSGHWQNPVVDMRPVEALLSGGPSVSLPILGTDPADAKGKTTFSVAPLKLADRSGYLYVSLFPSGERRLFGRAISNVALRSAAVVLVILMMLSFFSWLILNRSIRNGFDALRQSVSAFAAGDRPTTARAPEDGPMDFAILGRTFNQMADKITALIAALTQKDVMRRELISNVWHDVRTPVSRIGALCEVLKRDVTTPQAATACERLGANVELLGRILHDLQELGSMEAGDIQPKFEPFPIVDLVEEIVLAHADAAEKNCITLTFDDATPSPICECDPSMIARVLSNLVQNALRYTGAGGSVHVGVQLGDRVGLFVRDTGEGISADNLAKIFERNYQLQSSTGKEAGLSGLGLAIVKKIIEYHGDTVQVESSPGTGTIFRFSLPVWEPPMDLSARTAAV